MEKKYNLLFVILNILFFNLNAQNTFNRTYHKIVDTNKVPFYPESIVVTDTALYVKATTYFKDSIYWKEGGTFTKMDYQGNIIRDKMLGRVNRPFTSLYNNLQRDKDGTFYYTGGYYSGAFLTRLTENGDTLLVKDFSAHEFSSANSVRSTQGRRDTKGNFYFYVDRFYALNDNYCFLLKTDSLGNEIWKKPFRFNGYSTQGVNLEVRDSQTFWVNLVKFKDRTNDWTFKISTIVMSIDTAGNILSEFETPVNQLLACNATFLKNGDYLLHGVRITLFGTGFIATPIKTGYIARYNRNGQQLWERNLNTEFGFLEGVAENSDNTLIAVGQVYDGDNKPSGFLWKLSAIGDSLWARRFHAFQYPDYLYDYFIGIKKMSDGGFIAYGRTNNNNRTRIDAGEWGWIVRTDSFGCVERGCHLRDANVELQGQPRVLITVYPNPATHNIQFTWQDIAPSQTFLTFYDVSGKIVVQQSIEIGATQTEISVENQSNGIYFYKINFGNRFAAGKVIVAK
jgi:hypothetical protein